MIRREEVGDNLIRYHNGNHYIEVYAETGGHGCLFGFKIPEVYVEGMCWSGDDSKFEMRSMCATLNQIFKDYNCNLLITTRPTEIK